MAVIKYLALLRGINFLKDLLNNAWSCLVLFKEQIVTYHGDP